MKKKKKKKSKIELFPPFSRRILDDVKAQAGCVKEGLEALDNGNLELVRRKLKTSILISDDAIVREMRTMRVHDHLIRNSDHPERGDKG